MNTEPKLTNVVTNNVVPLFETPILGLGHDTPEVPLFAPAYGEAPEFYAASSGNDKTPSFQKLSGTETGTTVLRVFNGNTVPARAWVAKRIAARARIDLLW